MTGPSRGMWKAPRGLISRKNMFTTVFQNARASSYSRSCERGRASFEPCMAAVSDGVDNTIEDLCVVRRS